MQGNHTHMDNEKPERPVRNVFSQSLTIFLTWSDVQADQYCYVRADTHHKRNKRRLQGPSHRITASKLCSSPTILTRSQYEAAVTNSFPQWQCGSDDLAPQPPIPSSRNVLSAYVDSDTVLEASSRSQQKLCIYPGTNGPSTTSYGDYGYSPIAQTSNHAAIFLVGQSTSFVFCQSGWQNRQWPLRVQMPPMPPLAASCYSKPEYSSCVANQPNLSQPLVVSTTAIRSSLNSGLNRQPPI